MRHGRRPARPRGTDAPALLLTGRRTAGRRVRPCSGYSRSPRSRRPPSTEGPGEQAPLPGSFEPVRRNGVISRPEGAREAWGDGSQRGGMGSGARPAPARRGRLLSRPRGARPRVPPLGAGDGGGRPRNRRRGTPRPVEIPGKPRRARRPPAVRSAHRLARPAGDVLPHGARRYALHFRLHHQQAARRAGPLLAPGLVGLAPSDLAHRPHRPDRPVPVPDGHAAGETVACG